MTTKALASHHGRSALPLPSKLDPQIPSQKGKQIFSNNSIPTKNILDEILDPLLVSVITVRAGFRVARKEAYKFGDAVEFVVEGVGRVKETPGGKGVHRCRFRCLQMSMSNVNRVPCKYRRKCRKYIDLSREKNPKKPESYVGKMQNHMLIYIYIYIYIHTHTHTRRLIFQAFSRGKSAKN